MKNFLCCITIFCMIITPVKANSAPDISAESAVVIDSASKRVLYEKNSGEKRGMASTTKIMTALIAIESLDVNAIATISPFAASTEGSSIWLSPGEHMSVSDLLYGLMLSSGNDAAAALAEYTSGSIDSFTLLMNEKARSLGANNTHFTNPHGLPDDRHYTTANDLALIAAEAMQNELFKTIVSTKTKTISWEGSKWKRTLKNHNKLLSMYDGCVGIKTGFTKKDGRCLVSGAEKDNMLLIAVTLSAPDDWNDHIQLMNHCFDEYYAYTVCKKGEAAGRLKTDNALVDSIGISYDGSFTMALKDGEEEKVSIKHVFSPSYPILKGDIIGYADIYFEGRIISRINLTACDEAYIKASFGDIMINLLKGIMKT